MVRNNEDAQGCVTRGEERDFFTGGAGGRCYMPICASTKGMVFSSRFDHK